MGQLGNGVMAGGRGSARAATPCRTIAPTSVPLPCEPRGLAMGTSHDRWSVDLHVAAQPELRPPTLPVSPYPQIPVPVPGYLVTGSWISVT